MRRHEGSGNLSLEDSLEKEMAIHSTILAWEIPRTKEPGGLESMGVARVRHDLATKQQEQNYKRSIYSYMYTTTICNFLHENWKYQRNISSKDGHSKGQKW